MTFECIASHGPPSTASGALTGTFRSSSRTNPCCARLWRRDRSRLWRMTALGDGRQLSQWQQWPSLADKAVDWLAADGDAMLGATVYGVQTHTYQDAHESCIRSCALSTMRSTPGTRAQLASQQPRLGSLMGRATIYRAWCVPTNAAVALILCKFDIERTITPSIRLLQREYQGGAGDE